MPSRPTGTDPVPQPPLTDLAERINAEHAEVRRAFCRGLEHALACGRLLIRAKDACPHGGWLPWLSENCPDIPERLAQRYMRVARDINLLEERDVPNPTRVSDLSLRQALELLSYTAEEAKRHGMDDAGARLEEAEPVGDRLRERDRLGRERREAEDRERRHRERQARERAHREMLRGQREAERAADFRERHGPPARPAKDENQYRLAGLSEDALGVLLEEMDRHIDWYTALGHRLTSEYEYVLPRMATAAAEAIHRLRQRLTYDREQLQHAVYGIREIVEGSPGKVVPYPYLNDWRRKAGIGDGLFGLAKNILLMGRMLGPDGREWCWLGGLGEAPPAIPPEALEHYPAESRWGRRRRQKRQREQERQCGRPPAPGGEEGAPRPGPGA